MTAVIDADPQTSHPAVRGRWFAPAVIVSGAALAIIVGSDGTPAWQVIRVVTVAMVTIAVWRVVRFRSSTQSVIAVVTGTMGIIVGVGIGLMHLLKGDVTPAAVASLIVLVAGLLLFVLASADVLRAASWPMRLIAVPIAFLMLQFVFLPLIPAVYATNVPPTDVGTRTPADLGMTYDDVDMRTSDGVHLSAWYVPSRNRAAVVLLHGAGSTRGNVLDHAAVLQRHGYGVLLVDTRGHGRSGGDAMDFGWYGNRDVKAAVDFLSARSDIDAGKIGAVGMSMGGEQAITAAASDPRIRGVVGEGVETRTTADGERLPNTIRGQTERMVEWLTFTAADALTRASQPVGLRRALAQTAPRPVLIISGRGEIEGARYIRDGSPQSVALWELPDVAHTAGLRSRPAEWESRVIATLDTALQPVSW